MKKFKKIFAVLLTLAMVLGMSMTSFAADEQTGTFTVNGLNGSNVDVYYAPILKLDAATAQWVYADGVNQALVGMSEAQLRDENADLQSLTLKNLKYTPAGTSANGTFTSGQLPAGLYAVKAVDKTNAYVYSYMVAAIDYKDGAIQSATMNAKGQSNQPEKVITDTDKNSAVASKDRVEFKISVYYPTFATNSIDKSMVITDDVTNAKIDASTINIPSGYGLEIDREKTTNTHLVIKLDATQYDLDKAGEKVDIKYTVVVDDPDELEGNVVSNKVNTLIPNADGNSVPRQAIVNIPTVKAEITKANKDASGDPAITGSAATFELYKEVESGTTGAVEVDTIDGKKQMVLVDTRSTDTKTGVATFKGLDADSAVKYYVKETVAPEGFALESKAYPLTGATVTPGTAGEPTADANGVITVTTNNTATDFTNVGFGSGMKFMDSNLSSLPGTGGIGTTIFTIGGCAIMIIAAALFFASRRKSAK